MTEALYRDEDWLETQYIDRDRSLSDIAEECGVSDDAVNRWTKRYDLTPDYPWRNESWLREQYESGKTTTEIAENTDTTTAIISTWKFRHNIEVEKDYHNESWLRKHYREMNLTLSEISERSDYDPSEAAISKWLSKYNIVEKHRDPEWLRTKYIEDGLSSIKMAKLADTCPQTILNSLEKEGIDRVSNDEKWEKYDSWFEGLDSEEFPGYGVTGEDHPRYNNYDEKSKWRRSGKWRRLRKEVRERDNYTCQKCSESGKQVHHKLPVSHGGEKFDKDNPQVLCFDCHQNLHRFLIDYR